MAKFNPFRIQFDRPTWGRVKDIAEIIKGTTVDGVTIAVRVAYVVLSNPETMLSEEGQQQVKQVVRYFRDPTGTKEPTSV